MRETTPKEIIDARIDQAYRQWDGRPMDLGEIACLSGVKYEMLRRISYDAMRKLRRAGMPIDIQEYLTDEEHHENRHRNQENTPCRNPT